MNSVKMKKILSYLFSFILIVSIAGCSWITKFAVRNASDAPITIVYSMTPYDHRDTKERICPIEKWYRPEITTDYLWRFNTGNWIELPKERYVLNLEECSVELKLNPGESVHIATKGTYTGHEKSYGKESFDHLRYVIIKTEDGEIVLKGWELLKRFEKITDTLYLFSFE